MNEMVQVRIEEVLKVILEISLSFWYIVVFIIATGIYSLFKSRIKGYLGEKRISIILGFLDEKKYKVLNDILIKNKDKTSQIDHVVVSNFGIFVIETKNYKGLIIGKEKDNDWKQVIHKNTNKFYNPIKQNIGHVKAIREKLIDFPDTQIIPIVVFSNDAKVKVKCRSLVIYSAKLLKTIKRYKDICIDDKIKDDIYEILNSSNINSFIERKKHISKIKHNKRYKENKEDKCPRCNGILIIRKGKYGKFYGCSNFPKCRYTLNV